MISEIASKEKVIGVKQSRKAIREGRACQVFVACDADPAITEPVAQSCAEALYRDAAARRTCAYIPC